MAAKKFLPKDKGHKMTRKEVDALKDANGRLPDEAYTPKTIGYNLQMILTDSKCPKILADAFLLGLQDLPVPPFISSMSAWDDELENLRQTFLSNGCTVEELAAGAADLETKLLEYDRAQTKNLH